MASFAARPILASIFQEFGEGRPRSVEILTIFDGFGQSARFMAGLWLSRAGLHEYERDTFVEASWLDIDVMDSYLPVPP